MYQKALIDYGTSAVWNMATVLIVLMLTLCFSVLTFHRCLEIYQSLRLRPVRFLVLPLLLSYGLMVIILSLALTLGVFVMFLDT